MVTKIPRATIKRIAKEVSPEIRVGAKALTRLQDITTDFIRMTIVDSVKLSQHGNRKTVLEKDVILATD